MATWCSSKKFQLVLIAIAVITIITVLFILFISNWPSFAKQKIIDNVVFKNGSLGMQLFQNTSTLRNLRLSVSVFSVTNVDEVIKSAAKVKLKEYGPFVYREFKWKEVLDNNQETGLITYKLRRRFVFQPELSVGDPKKLQITWINVPVLSAIAYLDKLQPISAATAKFFFGRYLKSAKEQPFITDSVENFIFAGSYRKLFDDLYNNPLIRALVGNKWPLPDNKFALLYKKNNTWLPERDYIFTTAAGFGFNQTYKDLNQFKLMNGSSRLPFWNSGGDCNKLFGTDGEFFQPLLDSSTKLNVYSIDICRRLDLKFKQQTSLDGISVNQYTLDEKSLQSSRSNPDNKCYCLSEDSDECSLDGLIDLANCASNEVFASGSHFIHGSPELLLRVSGLRHPDPLRDDPTLYVEPNTGLTVQVNSPLQLNVRLRQNDYSIFKFFRDIKPLIVPLATVTEAAELEDDQANMLREKLLMLDSWFISMVLGGAIVLILVIIVLISVVCMRFRSSRQTASLPTESDPLLNPARRRRRSRSRERHRRRRQPSSSPA
jgi:hypothetical protein